MKKTNSILLGLGLILNLCNSCSDTNNTNNNTNTNTMGANTPGESVISTPSTSTSENGTASSQTDKPKSDEEIILEASELLVDGISDIAEIRRVKDSIREVNKERMYAFQIGIKMKESDAYEEYRKLINAEIPSVYVFKVGRKEFYLVQFEAKGKDELDLSLGGFKAKLGQFGTEGVKVKNLNEFCSKRESIAKETKKIDGDEVKCLYCD